MVVLRYAKENVAEAFRILEIFRGIGRGGFFFKLDDMYAYPVQGRCEKDYCNIREHEPFREKQTTRPTPPLPL